MTQEKNGSQVFNIKLSMLDMAKMTLHYSNKIVLNKDDFIYLDFSKNELLELLMVMIEKDNAKSLEISELEKDINNLYSQLFN